jgi:class 3 adenylate cyclase/tetratricopeptide (TPR) repeat protein
MRCSKCGSDNREGRKFCTSCGTPLVAACPKCGAPIQPDERFCGECGTALGDAAPRATSSAQPRPLQLSDAIPATEVIDGERKTVTALFADIKGSTELMRELDPEEARAIIDPVLQLMMDAVRRSDGYIVQSTGDGIFALFGAPLAHEDHPQRALYAVLRMQEELRRYSTRIVADGGSPIQCRVGANTGEVVVRSIATGEGRAEYTPIGHTTNLASRMQAVAPVGSIAVSDTTRHWCEGYFAFKSLGPTRLRGVPAPIEVHEVTGLGPLRTRLQRAAGRGLTKFVGREREIESMRHAAAMAKDGRGQIVAAMAEPGVGKSRLFYEFKAASGSGWMMLEALSISHGKASAYLPVLDLLHNYFEISLADDERKRREKVAGKITVLDRSLEDTLPYLFSLLGIVDGDDPLAQTDGQIKKRRTLEAIKRILLRESLKQPLMVVFEDLHWMDGESEGLLNLLADSIATSRVLLLVNYRPEYRHQWGSKTYYTQLRLDPLGKESADDMLSALLGSVGRLAPLKRLIAEKTEGNPLFMEEIVLSLFEDGALARNGEVNLAKPLASLRIPPTVQGILASRIDRLPADEKDLLQTVAVIGTEFNLGVARAASGKSDDDLNRMLNALQLAEFIYEQPATDDVEYTFKHALTHDVAYNSVLTERRKVLHEGVAHAVESLYAERLEDHLTELAYHFERSSNVPKAVEYLGRTGARAAQQVAHSEAIGYFTRALELLRRLPDGTTRDSQELDLQMAVSWSVSLVQGPLTPERESALIRARELCEHLGDDEKLMQALLALAHFRFNRRDFGSARELAERVLAMTQQAGARATAAGAHAVIGLVRSSTGQFPAAREHLERTVELLGAGPYRNYGALFVRLGPAFLTGVLVVLGYPSTALRKADELLAAARRSSDPLSIATALMSYLMRHVEVRDRRMVAERADEMQSIATEYGLAYFLTAATFFRGWAMAAGGRGAEGIAEMRQHISDPMVAAAAATAQMLVAPAETCGRNGRAEEGLELVAKGLATAEQTDQRLAEAELYRLKGEPLEPHSIR